MKAGRKEHSNWKKSGKSAGGEKGLPPCASVRHERRPEERDGVFHRNSKGFGFVTVEGMEGDVFVPAGATMQALTGDLVRVRMDGVREARGASGRIVLVRNRVHTSCVGVLTEQGGRAGVRPMSRELPDFIPLNADRETGVWGKGNEWVAVDLKWDGGSVSAVPSRRIAKQGTVAADLAAVMREFGIPGKYTSAQEKAAQKLPLLEIPREDCRKLEVFTCDPVDARDYDDALSFQKLSKGKVCIGVHIADVACYVQAGSRLDAQARERAFTAYLPGRTIGMLPDALAADLCSLREGVDRPAHSVFLTVDVKSGKILDSRRCHTWIRSRKRLCYEEVDRVLAGEKIAGISPAMAKLLAELDCVTGRMRQWREEQEQFLPMDIPEIRVLCTGNPPRVVGFAAQSHGRSGEIIEECMLAANVRVAMEMRARQIPGMYRNHAQPAREHLTEFAGIAESVLHCRSLKLHRRTQMVNFLKRLRGEAAGEVLAMSLLRMLPRAEYDVRPQEHYGLGKETYCHFTSPIRRYPDLLTHRQLLCADMGKVGTPKKSVAALADSCNQREIQVDQACFAASDRLKIRKMTADADSGNLQPYRAVVCRVVPSGISLYLPEVGLMGFLEAHALGCGSWKMGKDGLSLSNGREIFRYGDTVRVLPERPDMVRGTVGYRLVSRCSAKKKTANDEVCSFVNIRK